MGVTKKIPRAEWKAYFDRFTRRHLAEDGSVHSSAAVELVSPSLGDQIEDSQVALLGLTYDPRSNAFELDLDEVDHMVFHPVAIAVIEEEDGFISALELEHDDGTKEIVRLRRVGEEASSQESRPEG